MDKLIKKEKTDEEKTKDLLEDYRRMLLVGLWN